MLGRYSIDDKMEWLERGIDFNRHKIMLLMYYWARWVEGDGKKFIMHEESAMWIGNKNTVNKIQELNWV